MSDFITDVIDEDLLRRAPVDQFEEVQEKETDEYLSRLGYLDSEIDINITKRYEAIRKFRRDLTDSADLAAQYDLDLQEDSVDLTEDELNFLANICSLENDFYLHDYTLAEIEQVPMLCRILTFRLESLYVFDINAENQLSLESKEAIKLLHTWLGDVDEQSILQSIGDIDLLASKLVHKTTYPGIIILQNKVDKKDERRFVRKANDLSRFESKLPTTKLEMYRSLFAKKNALLQNSRHKLNKVLIQLLQHKLRHLGLYDRQVDNDFGLQSFTALKNFMSFYHENFGKTNGVALQDFLGKCAENFWVINVRYLFEVLFPQLESDPDTNIVKPTTICEEINELVALAGKEQEEDIMVHLAEQIKPKTDDHEKRPKNRGGKGIFAAITRFIKKATKALARATTNVVQFIKEKITKLFKLVKNGVQMLIREIKKAFNLIAAGVRFLFSKRKISTSNNKIVSDYDFDFDCMVSVKEVDRDTINAHIAECERTVDQFEKTAEFLGVVLKIAINIGKGPTGWIKLGLQLIRKLAQSGFRYQKFTFT